MAPCIFSLRTSFHLSGYLTNIRKQGDLLVLIHCQEMYDLTDASKYYYRSNVKWKYAFEHVKDAQIQIILRMRKVLSGLFFPFIHSVASNDPVSEKRGLDQPDLCPRCPHMGGQNDHNARNCTLLYSPHKGILLSSFRPPVRTKLRFTLLLYFFVKVFIWSR